LSERRVHPHNINAEYIISGDALWICIPWSGASANADAHGESVVNAGIEAIKVGTTTKKDTMKRGCAWGSSNRRSLFEAFQISISRYRPEIKDPCNELSLQYEITVPEINADKLTRSGTESCVLSGGTFLPSFLTISCMKVQYHVKFVDAFYQFLASLRQ
jgi:hypothetical protein